MEHKTLKEVYKNSSEEVKAILKEKYSNQDLGIGINQEEFNQFFREILEKYKNNVRFTNDNFYRYEIFDDNGEWLFEINYNPENQWFLYSICNILPLFEEKFGGNKQELNELMIPVVEQDFKLAGVAPLTEKDYMRTLVEQFKLAGVAPINLMDI